MTGNHSSVLYKRTEGADMPSALLIEKNKYVVIKRVFSQTYSAPFSASTMSILRLFRATSRPTARETPKVSSTLTQ